MDDRTAQVIESLQELTQDNIVPKNVRDGLQSVIKYLSEEGELSLKIDKALHKLEEISEDNNLQTYTRTQIWNIVSILESIK